MSLSKTIFSTARLYQLTCLSLLTFLTVLTPVYGHSLYSDEDDSFVQSALNLNKRKFQVTAQPDVQLNTQHSEPYTYIRQALEALQHSQSEQFYRLLAKNMANSPIQSENNTSNLVQTTADFNPVQVRVFNEMRDQSDTDQLANWLQNYIKLDKLLKKNSHFFESVLDMLTSEELDKTGYCPELTLINNTHYVKSRRRIVLRCLSNTTGLSFIDMDISRNRVIQSKVISPGVNRPELVEPPTVSVESISSHLESLDALINNPEALHTILVTTPSKSGYLISHKKPTTKHLQETQPKQPNKASSKSLREQMLLKQVEKLSTSRDQYEPYTPNAFIQFITTYRLFSSFVMIGAGIGAVYLMITAPYPGNPFLF